jgi:hypothetical protein
VKVKTELITDDTVRTNGRWEHCKLNFDCQFKRRTSFYKKRDETNGFEWELNVKCDAQKKTNNLVGILER